MVAGTDDVGGGAPPGKGQPGRGLQRELGVLDCVLLSVGGMVWSAGALAAIAAGFGLRYLTPPSAIRPAAE